MFIENRIRNKLMRTRKTERISEKEIQGRRHKLKSIWSFQVKFEIKGNKKLQFC